MRSLLAIIAAKVALKTNRITGSGGTALPGMLAQKLDKDILRKLVLKNFPKGIIVVTGTNGKTTTSRFIANILEEAGISYVHNRAGSNMERGLISTMAENTNLYGRVDADVALFEVDEAFMPKVCRAIEPDTIVVTNLFRDQLDRYGELDKIARSFRNLFEDLPNTKLVLNADDPLVASLGYELENERKATYFGVGDYNGPKITNDHTADSIFDPFTQQKLHYTDRYFGHIGRYRGKRGGFTRPKPDFQANNVRQKGIENIKFDVNKTSKAIKLEMPGLFNVYNAIAAYSVAKICLDTEENNIISALNESSAVFGRSEQLNYLNREVVMLLIKNPTGLNQIIQTYLLKEKDRLLVFVINDNFADGRDISWLWDAAFEDLKGYRGKILVGGTRAYDMALRLKYAGLKGVSIESDENSLLKMIEKNSTRRSKIFILPTYTAMLSMRSKIAANDDKAKEFWQ
ncbi:MAG: MurT ligase domain-containing protein [Candidatus Saccharibacteria bacterium]|jgi:UDP-N-acetylmuramyl tripeptide synthase